MRNIQSQPDAEQALHRFFEDRHSELFWLAYLLTGDRDLSLQAVVEAFEPQELPRPFFHRWMAAWARRLVIARALASIAVPLAASARETDWQDAELSALDGQMPAPGTTRLELERAFLATGLFPRCALLLTVFEKVSLDDAAVLLDASKEQIRRAKMAGLVQLCRNLGQVATVRAGAAAQSAVWQFA